MGRGQRFFSGGFWVFLFAGWLGFFSPRLVLVWGLFLLVSRFEGGGVGGLFWFFVVVV